MSERQQTPTAAEPAHTSYARCDQCSSPVDVGQRYCVVCGSRNKRAEDPVARYLAVATSRARAVKAPRPDATRKRRAPGLATAAVIAAIPLAVALGVIVGRANSGGDAALIRALKAQKAPVVTVTGGGAGAITQAASATTNSVASTFSLKRGYTIELEALPGGATGTAAVARAERAAKAKGATGIGVINEGSFSVSPKPPGDVYVIYSGQFRTRAAAQAALAKLKKRFPAATVIAVRAVIGQSSSSTSSSSSSASGSQVTTHVTQAQVAQGAKEVKQISHATGGNYVQAQNNLPGQVSVP